MRRARATILVALATYGGFGHDWALALVLGYVALRTELIDRFIPKIRREKPAASLGTPGRVRDY